MIIRERKFTEHKKKWHSIQQGCPPYYQTLMKILPLKFSLFQGVLQAISNYLLHSCLLVIALPAEQSSKRKLEITVYLGSQPLQSLTKTLTLQNTEPWQLWDDKAHHLPVLYPIDNSL